MSKTYIAGDLKLFDRAAARQINKSTREYNNYIIRNINSVVSKEDNIFLCGDVSKNDNDETNELLKKINGYITIICNKDKYINLTFPKWHGDGFVTLKDYSGKDIQVIYLCDDTFLEYFVPRENTIIAAPTSISGIKDKIGERYLNLSIEALEYYPIEINEIGRHFEDIKLFESMEDFEEKELN